MTSVPAFLCIMCNGTSARSAHQDAVISYECPGSQPEAIHMRLEAVQPQKRTAIPGNAAARRSAASARPSLFLLLIQLCLALGGAHPVPSSALPSHLPVVGCMSIYGKEGPPCGLDASQWSESGESSGWHDDEDRYSDPGDWISELRPPPSPNMEPHSSAALGSNSSTSSVSIPPNDLGSGERSLAPADDGSVAETHAAVIHPSPPETRVHPQQQQGVQQQQPQQLHQPQLQQNHQQQFDRQMEPFMPVLQPTGDSGTVVPPSPEEVWLCKHQHDSFVPVKPKPRSKASSFQGKKEGWFFGTGVDGLGYYRLTPMRIQLCLHQSLGLYTGSQPTKIDLASVVPAAGIPEARRTIARLHDQVASSLWLIRRNLNAMMIAGSNGSNNHGSVSLQPQQQQQQQQQLQQQQQHFLENNSNKSNNRNWPPRQKLFASSESAHAFIAMGVPSLRGSAHNTPEVQLPPSNLPPPLPPCETLRAATTPSDQDDPPSPPLCDSTPPHIPRHHPLPPPRLHPTPPAEGEGIVHAKRVGGDNVSASYCSRSSSSASACHLLAAEVDRGTTCDDAAFTGQHSWLSPWLPPPGVVHPSYSPQHTSRVKTLESMVGNSGTICANTKPTRTKPPHDQNAQKLDLHAHQPTKHKNTKRITHKTLKHFLKRTAKIAKTSEMRKTHPRTKPTLFGTRGRWGGMGGIGSHRTSNKPKSTSISACEKGRAASTVRQDTVTSCQNLGKCSNDDDVSFKAEPLQRHAANISEKAVNVDLRDVIGIQPKTANTQLEAEPLRKRAADSSGLNTISCNATISARDARINGSVGIEACVINHETNAISVNAMISADPSNEFKDNDPLKLQIGEAGQAKTVLHKHGTKLNDDEDLLKANVDTRTDSRTDPNTDHDANRLGMAAGSKAVRANTISYNVTTSADLDNALKANDSLKLHTVTAGEAKTEMHRYGVKLKGNEDLLKADVATDAADHDAPDNDKSLDGHAFPGTPPPKVRKGRKTRSIFVSIKRFRLSNPFV